MTESKTALVEQYKSLKLPGHQLCSRWKEETLAEKLAAHGSCQELECVASVATLIEPIEETPIAPDIVIDETPDEVEETAGMSPPVEPSTPELAELAVVQTVEQQIRDGDRSPMCLGLAMLLDGVRTFGDLVVVPDANVKWVSMAFLPRGWWRGDGALQDRHVMQVRRTSVHYGVPSVGPDGVETVYDLSKPPVVDPADADQLPLNNRRLVQIANRLRWGMLSTGFAYRSLWAGQRVGWLRFLQADGGMQDLYPRRLFRAWRTEFEKTHGRLPHNAECLNNALVFGGNTTSPSDSVRGRGGFMPHPLVAFPVKLREQLFDHTTIQRMWDGEPTRAMPYVVLNSFLRDVVAHDGVPVYSPFDGEYLGHTMRMERSGEVRDLIFRTDAGERRVITTAMDSDVDLTTGDEVFVGQLLGKETMGVLPPTFGVVREVEQARMLRASVDRVRLDAIIGWWFKRQQWEIEPGFVHVPLSLASVACCKDAVQGRLYWRLTKESLEYYDDETESLILPTIGEFIQGTHVCPIKAPAMELAMDLTIQDQRWLSPPTRWFGTSQTRDRAGKQTARETEEYMAVRANVRKPAKVHKIGPRQLREVFTGEPVLPNLSDDKLDATINGNR